MVTYRKRVKFSPVLGKLEESSCSSPVTHGPLLESSLDKFLNHGVRASTSRVQKKSFFSILDISRYRRTGEYATLIKLRCYITFLWNSKNIAKLIAGHRLTQK